MSKEIDWPDIASRSGKDVGELEKTEKTSTTNRRRRVGEFDWVMLRRATLLNRPTDVALTFTDYINAEDGDAKRFDQLTAETIRFIEEIESVCEAPVSLIATGFNWLDWARCWYSYGPAHSRQGSRKGSTLREGC